MRQLKKIKSSRGHYSALKITLIYTIFSLIWIFFSDKILLSLIKDIELLTRIQMFKGWTFVIATALIIYFLLLREITKIKLAEKKIHTSEENYREIFNATKDAILIYDPHTYNINDVNLSMLDLFGYTYKEALQLNIGDLILRKGPYSWENKLIKFKQVSESGHQVFEWKYLKKSGGWFWVEVSLQSSKIKEQQKVIAVVRDISSRKQEEMEKKQLLYIRKTGKT